MTRFMKYERILLLLGYPWAIFFQNLGGWVNNLQVSFILWTGGLLDKLPFLPASELLQFMKTSSLVQNSIHNSIHNSELIL